MATTTVAIAGFTGKMARLITEALLSSHSDVVVHGICRSLEKVAADLKSNPRVKVFQAASDDAKALGQAVKGAEICICCYLGDNTLMTDGQKTLIDACIAAGVPRYMAGDWCFDYRGLEVGDHPTKDPMVLIRRYIEENEKAGMISGVHVLDGGFMEVAWAPSLWPDAANAKFTYYGTGDEPLDMMTMPDVAKYSAELAYDKSAKGFFEIIGDKLSVKKMAETYARVYGLEPQVERQGSLENLSVVMKEKMRADPYNIYAWMGFFYQYWMAKDVGALNGPIANDRYPGFKPLTVEDFLKKHTKESVGQAYYMV